MSGWLKWSQVRLLVTLGILYLLFAEVISLLLSDDATCIVNPAKYSAYYAESNECPAFHIFLFKIAASIFEILGDPNWVIAISAIVTATFTVILGVFTVSLSKSTRIAANAAEKALTELERPWLFVEGAKITRRDPPGGDIIPNNWYISLKCRNVGRSPAVVHECIIGFCDKNAIPVSPDYAATTPISTLRWVSPDQPFDTTDIGPSPRADNRDVDFIAFGRITYTELNGRLHTTGFAVEVSRFMAAFSSYPSDAYDYYD
jgi:hypothetical protein